MPAFFKGDKVTWKLSDGTPGSGVVISDMENGHVLVAVDPAPTQEFHEVIWCTVTWLTKV